MSLPVGELEAAGSHLCLRMPYALLVEDLETMRRRDFVYKTDLVWYKVRRGGGPEGRGVGFYFRNVTEAVLFGVRGPLRTLGPGRTRANIIVEQKRDYSRKPEQLEAPIEACSPGPYLELFARRSRPGWVAWGDEADTGVRETRPAR